jgi:hypothetical protein
MVSATMVFCEGDKVRLFNDRRIFIVTEVDEEYVCVSYEGIHYGCFHCAKLIKIEKTWSRNGE